MNVIKRTQGWLVFYLITILAISYLTHFHNYSYPAALFWDENYHIPAAEKYLSHVFFHEYHPPLGKLLIALGEYMFHPNDKLDISSMLSASYIKDVPAGFSFVGVRFFPALFGWLSVALFFLTLFFLINNPHLAFIFSSLYMFENSMIVHFRGAMLDSIQLFFVLATLAYFSFAIKKTHISLFDFAALGALIGCVISTKVNGAVMCFFVIYLAYCSYRNETTSSSHKLKFPLIGICCSALVATFLFLGVWFIHFSFGNHAIGDKWYGATEKTQLVVKQGGPNSLRNFSIELVDAYRFFVNDNKGVPKLDICKAGENGSPAISWLLGGKSINYRWGKTGDGMVSYLYLQVNPLVIILGGVGLILCIILVSAHFVFGLEISNRQLFVRICFFLFAYLAYMAIMLRIERVMYFYHYFIPYIFSLILLYLLVHYIYESEIKNSDRFTMAILVFFAVQIFGAYLYYSPLTYYRPLSYQDINDRALIKTWKLAPIL